MSTITHPRWPRDTGGPRALVECEDPVIQDGLVRVLHEEGYVVAACGGPRARASHACPLVSEGTCGLVEGADVVVHALDGSDPANRAILASIREQAPETPVVIEVGPRANASTELAAGCEPVGYPMTRQALLDAVERAITRRG